MFPLFSRIILSNWRSLVVLFCVIIFASSGFITLRQITTNIESLVASETRPLFGADLIISTRGYASGNILPHIAPYLTWEQFIAAERREFSTTLLDKMGKASLIQVVAYSGTYPQRWILNLSSWVYTGWVVVTPWLFEKFANSGTILLDNKKLIIADTILESSDLGFSLGTEDHLIVLHESILSGSLLLSSWSRLNHSLYISFDDERRAGRIADILKNVLPDSQYRVRTFEERTERNLETVETLTDYITLILLVSSIFAFVILRSAHESFFENLSRTLRVTEILGLTRRRQQILLLMLYGVVFPIAFILGIGISDGIIWSIRRIPEANEFQFIFTELPHSLFLLIAIGVMAFFPAWWTMGIRENKEEGIELFAFKNGSEFIWTEEQIDNNWNNKLNILKYLFWKYFRISLKNLSRPDIFVPFSFGILILIILFGNPLFSLLVWGSVWVFFFIFGHILWYLYRWIFQISSSMRKRKFFFYDALRTLVRPLTPTIPITVSLVSVTVFFLIFVSFSLAFRSKLVIDSTFTANIYAINVLETDKWKVQEKIGSGALMYDILRARISKVNGKSLAEHLKEENPSGEFTREFNITTTSLENKIIRWKERIGKWEVSIDYEFSWRLGISLGDTVTFLLSGREITLTVANIRESVREGFRPFFYFSFDPVEFKNAPRTYFVAEYAADTEQWKRSILAASGPHVTFIDIESILKIVRDISSKVLSVIGLFFIVVFLFAIGAIVAFFMRIRPIEDMKSRLYNLFGANTKDIHTSLAWTRITLFIVSYILSIIIGWILSYYTISIGWFFQFSIPDYLLISAMTGVTYLILIGILRK